jgi:hypothetical protein
LRGSKAEITISGFDDIQVLIVKRIQPQDVLGPLRELHQINGIPPMRGTAPIFTKP